MEITPEILWYGKDEPLPDKVMLRAGQLSIVYENGFIRYVKVNGEEVLRMINHAVRDHNWGTIPMRIYDEEISKYEDAFTITYNCEVKQGDIEFLWHCRIEGSTDNTIKFAIEGEAMSSFKRNRAGFTVMHPIKECMGREVKVTNPDGKVHVHQFPELISPFQPFVDIQAMEWEVAGGSASLVFGGDTFETEDQRNWLDDSYKTYCTPLGKPYPVLLQKGDKVTQEVTLRVKNNGKLHEPGDEETYSFALADQPCTLPKIGIAQSTETNSLTSGQVSILGSVQFDHYQADLRLYEGDVEDKWRRIVSEAEALNLPIELGLFCDDVHNELPLISSAVKKQSGKVVFVNIFELQNLTTQQSTLQQVVPVVRGLFPDAKIGSGTNAYFTQLNREHVDTGLLDFVTYSVNPQVHSFDNASLLENLSTFRHTVDTARSISNGEDVRISPVSLKIRWNPDATGEDIVSPGQLPSNVDVRQMSLFGEGWTLGVFNELLRALPDAVTLFETVGMKGIMQVDNPACPELFPSDAGDVYPMFFVMKRIMDFRDNKFFHLHTSDRLRLTGLAIGEASGAVDRLILANLTNEPLKIMMPASLGGSIEIIIDDQNVEGLMKDPKGFDELGEIPLAKELELKPYGLAFIKLDDGSISHFS